MFFCLFFIFLIQVDCGNFLDGTANLAFQWIFLEGNGETSIYSVSGRVELTPLNNISQKWESSPNRGEKW